MKITKLNVKPKHLSYNMFDNLKEWSFEWLEAGTFLVINNDSIIISEKVLKTVKHNFKSYSTQYTGS